MIVWEEKCQYLLGVGEEFAHTQADPSQELVSLHGPSSSVSCAKTPNSIDLEPLGVQLREPLVRISDFRKKLLKRVQKVLESMIEKQHYLRP